MERFRETIKKRTLVMRIGLLIYAIVMVVFLAVGLFEQKAEAHWLCYQSGLIVGLSGVAAVLMIRYNKALNNEALLNELYIKENDERRLLVYQKSGSLGMNIVMFGLIIASIFASHFNFTVFVTLVVTCFAVALVRTTLKIYYNSKY